MELEGTQSSPRKQQLVLTMSAQQKNSTTSFVKNLVLGGASGCTAKTICAPLERVKIAAQTGRSASGVVGARPRW